MADPHPRTAAALIIGNELLSGKVHEQNLFCLAGALRALGIALRRVVMIPDEMDRIVDEVFWLSRNFDHLFTSGGVGPTHDDLTVAAVARAFSAEVALHEQMADMIRAHFGAQLRPSHLLMARIPIGCTLVRDEDGMWPTILMHNVWLLPGVPEIFRMRLPAIKRHLAGGQPFVSRAVYTSLDEGNLVPLLEDVVRRFPKVDVGSYPKWNDPTYRTKLTFDSLDADEVARASEAFIALLPDGEPLSVA